jgi:DNA-binding IclR family transcriptional regulator
LGKALLSGMSNEQIRQLYRDGGRMKKSTPNTIDSVDKLLVDIAKTRNEGVAYDNEELYSGVSCMGAPVRDFSGRVVAALSISSPKYRLKSRDMPRFKKLLLESCAELSHGLGHTAASAASAR